MAGWHVCVFDLHKPSRSADRRMWSLDKGLAWTVVVCWRRHHRYQGDSFVGSRSGWTSMIYWIRGMGWPGQAVRDYRWHLHSHDKIQGHYQVGQGHIKLEWTVSLATLVQTSVGRKAIEYAKIKLNLFTMACCVYRCILSRYRYCPTEIEGQCRGHNMVVWLHIDKGRAKAIQTTTLSVNMFCRHHGELN